MPNREIPESKFQELLDYYITAKKHLLYSENYLHSTSIGVVNELRNALDHIMRGLERSEEKELDKAIRHFKRAAYDSCELISIDFTVRISEKLNKFDTDIILKVLPNYYSEVYPRLIEIQKTLATERGKNDDLFDAENGDHLTKYSEMMNELIDLDILISKSMVGMEEYRSKRKKEKSAENRRAIIINIVVGILSAIAATVITSLFL